MKHAFAAATLLAVTMSGLSLVLAWRDSEGESSQTLLAVHAILLVAVASMAALRWRERRAEKRSPDPTPQIEASFMELDEPLPSLDLGERTRQQLVQRRRQRLESLGTLASGIVHDLNNLLTPILMSSRMLQRESANVDRAALLETISSSASRGANLIGQLLTFARGGEGQHHPLQIDRLIPDVIAILRHTLPETVQLETVVEPDLPAVMGDETEISQVLMNLAINARDAMPGGDDWAFEPTRSLWKLPDRFRMSRCLPGATYPLRFPIPVLGSRRKSANECSIRSSRPNLVAREPDWD